MTVASTRFIVTAAAIGAALIAAPSPGEAHKPITSPFTFNEDVFPIVRDRCAACHVSGGVAPMSLLTHPEALPWGESIRVELLSGHMPPWSVDSAPARFRNVQMLSAREMNVLLTWVSGGTPPGDPEKPPPAVDRQSDWPLGTPDLVLPLPETTLAADAQELIADFTIALPPGTRRTLRAVDLLAGTPAIVRSAIVTAASGEAASPLADDASTPERTLALWLPGDHPLPLDEGTAFRVPDDGRLSVRIRYRKTWEYERTTMTDRSRVGLYFAREPAAETRAIVLTPAGAVTREPLRAVAIYPDPSFADANVRVSATRPNGSREELIAFRPNRGWARRYWFVEAIPLPAGTRLAVEIIPEGEGVLPPGAPPPPPVDPSTVRLILNVVPD
jgi:hypothetical protein